MRTKLWRTVVVAVVCASSLPALRGAPARAGVQTSSVRSYLREGRYQDAEDAARALLAAETTTRDGRASASALEAADLFVEALWRNGRSIAAETRALAEETVATKARLSGNDSFALLPSLRNLGRVHLAAGRYREALDTFERVLAVCEAACSARVDLADALTDRGRALISVEQYERARESLERALEIDTAILDAGDVRSASTMELLAVALQRRGEYARARPLLVRAMAIREAVLPHPELAALLAAWGTELYLEGQIVESRAAHARSLAIAQQTLRVDHPDLALYLRNLSVPSAELGDLDGALSLRQRALKMAESTVGTDHPIFADLTVSLANLHVVRGEYQAADRLYHRALAFAERRLGPDAVATICFNLALVSQRLGDLAEARRLHSRAMTIWQQQLGPDHPTLGRALAVLGELYLEQGQPASALPLLERALAIRQKRLGPNNRDVARTMGELATASADVGRVTRAETLSAEALQIWQRTEAADSPGLAQALVQRAGLLSRTGDWSDATVLYERALPIQARVYGRQHPAYTSSLAAEAIVLARLGRPAEAFSAALDAEQAIQEHLRLTLRYLPERQALEYLSRRPKSIDVLLSMIANGQGDPSAAALAFDAVVKGRAFVLDELAARLRASSDSDDVELRQLRSAFASATRRVANLAVRGPSEDRPAQYLALFADAVREKEDAERRLAEKSVPFRTELSRQRVASGDVRAQLSGETVIVSYVRYERLVDSKTPSKAGAQTVLSYLAFVAPAGAAVSAIPLGAASTIDAAVHAWRDEARGRSLVAGIDAREVEATYRRIGATLRRRIWDPVISQLGDASHVLIVPDGALNLVSFAALPTGARGYLVEQSRTIHYLSAERDVMPAESATATSGMLAVGGAAFDVSTQKSVPVSAMSVSRSGCGSLESVHFENLPGSRAEVSEIARMWSANASGTQTVLTGRAATETAVKNALVGRRVIHLATHGFFLDSNCSAAPPATRSVGALASSQAPAPRPVVENPLLLSGVALAGANDRARAAAGADDGILTAEEVASLSLQGAEWVVLSACDTGLGEVKAGEGVFGLRRAFQIAGARTVIMSLWSIDDQAARQWMRALYQDRLVKRLSTSDAVRDATLSVLRTRRGKGESTHPFYWAGFVAAGDWR